MKFCKKYDSIYNENKNKSTKCINVERARLKRDTSLFSVITFVLTIFGLLLSLSNYASKADWVLVLGLIIMGAVGVAGAYRASNNQFELSILDDILSKRKNN